MNTDPDDEIEAEVTNPALVRFGHDLRAVRKAHAHTGIELAEKTKISQGQISKIETGKARIPAWSDVERLLAALDASREEISNVRRSFDIAELDPSSFEAIHAAGSSNKQLQFRRLEANTRLFRGFYLSVMPGLTQLSEYAEGIFASLGLPPSEAKAAAEARMSRQAITSDNGRQFNFVLLEVALYSHHPRGATPQVLAAQLDHLSRMSHRRNVSIRVVPTGAGISARTACPFLILDRRYVSAETVISELTSTSPREIEQYESMFGELESSALSRDDSRRLIERAYERVNS